jgi:dUTP pyrophosphatase
LCTLAPNTSIIPFSSLSIITIYLLFRSLGISAQKIYITFYIVLNAIGTLGLYNHKIDTGLQLEIPDGYFAAIFARSGIASKEGLRPANCTGVCDSDYRGNYIVALHNDSGITRVVEPGERIAQMIVMPYLGVSFEEADTLSDTERGGGGFGSTGRK